MTTVQKIRTDLEQSLRKEDKRRCLVLRSVLASIRNAEIAQQKDLDGGFGISFGFGKDGKKKKRGNPNISKRAEIVKQVMKEQGLGMIQASQYVKAHNLY